MKAVNTIPKTDQTKYRIMPGNPYPLGVTKIGKGINFAVSLHRECKCILHLFQCGSKEAFLRIPLGGEYAVGTVYSVRIEGLKETEFEYAYVVDDVPWIDPYSVSLTGREQWGVGCSRDENEMHSRVTVCEYDWQGDQSPRYPFEQVIMYSIHVRGFTRHSSSGVKAKGTFRGIIERIPYLKELGINQIELLPAYDFYELADEEDLLPSGHPKYEKKEDEGSKTERVYEINYWGFTEGFYFTPKASYAYDRDAAAEFKDMVKALHKAGIEVVMQFYFPKCVNRNLILDCIRYWVLEYHIDGVHLQGEELPVTLIATNPVLADTKIYYYDFDVEEIYKRAFHGKIKNLALYNQEFSCDMRRFLKSDEDMLQAFTYRMRRIPQETGVINYMTQYEGFTLYDLVSYDFKHNEANGEENRDGNNYNYSWNCGIEGPTQKKAVLALRKKQMKNALVFLFLSQGTPMLLAGDEAANTQGGNNNPYCQDNATAWVVWGKNRFSQEIYEFTKHMISLRKAHPILHRSEELRIMDYISCGYPDLSYHGDSAWYPKFDNHIRHIGVMLCGKYAMRSRTEEDNFFFIACNMHWDIHEFGLPKLPKAMQWYIKVDTGAKNGCDFYEDGEEILLSNQEKLIVADRTTVVLIALENTLCYDVKRNKKDVKGTVERK